jgi:hypothetical protein
MVRFMRGLPTPDYNQSSASPTSAPGAPVPPHGTFTGFIGKVCNYPLRGIIYLCVKFRISPNVLTFVGMVVNVTAAVLLGFGQFRSAGFIILVANIFDAPYKYNYLARPAKVVPNIAEAMPEVSPDWRTWS